MKSTTKPSAQTILIALSSFSVASLLISNLAATKLFNLGGIPMDGGIILFPLVFILSDLIAELFGKKPAKATIFTAFALNLLAAIVFFIVQVLPPAIGWDNQSAYEVTLGLFPRILAASLISYLISSLLDLKVFIHLKKPKITFLRRSIISTLVGNLANSLVFCTIAFLGIVSVSELFQMIGLSLAIIVPLSIVLAPVAAIIVRKLKNYV